jgi:hypothetical protein
VNHDELVFVASLTRINERISRLVFRVMDEASGRSTTEYTVPLADVEYALGKQLVDIGESLKHRAQEKGGLVVLDGEVDLNAEPPPPELSDPARRKPDIPEF